METLIKQCKWDEIPADYKDQYGRTVAMLASLYGRIKDLPKRFYHDPNIIFGCNYTVAMIEMYFGNIKDLPREFYHDPTIADTNGFTLVI